MWKLWNGAPPRAVHVGHGARVFMNLACVAAEECRSRRKAEAEEEWRREELIEAWRKEFFEEVVRLTAELEEEERRVDARR